MIRCIRDVSLLFVARSAVALVPMRDGRTRRLTQVRCLVVVRGSCYDRGDPTTRGACRDVCRMKDHGYGQVHEHKHVHASLSRLLYVWSFG